MPGLCNVDNGIFYGDWGMRMHFAEYVTGDRRQLMERPATIFIKHHKEGSSLYRFQPID